MLPLRQNQQAHRSHRGGNGHDFLDVMIEHYRERIQDKSVPLMVRADFKKALDGYESRQFAPSTNFFINKSTVMEAVVQIPEIKASDLINAAHELEARKLRAEEVTLRVYPEHITIHDAANGQLLSWTKREAEA